MKYATELKYGAIFAAIVVVYVMLEHILGFNTTNHAVGQYSRFGGVLVPIFGVLFGLIAKRRELGFMTIGQGIKSGFVIAITQTTLTTIWFLIYPNFINTEFYPTLLAFEQQKLMAQGIAASDIESRIGTLRWMFSFPVQPIFQMIIGVAYGVVFAMVFSLILRRKQPQRAS